MKDSSKSNNSLLTEDSAEALDILVDAITKADCDSTKFVSRNYNMIDKYVELIEKSDIYDKNRKEPILNRLAPSRHSNQLKVEELAKYAGNIDVAHKYLSENREMEK